ncbi:MAG: TraR/DksA family transcriptional regulator [Myxococcales bacterium]|nr:TraR/DksA family transcriptional regulator [Myxococcales bacterium]MCB9565716.1 TraR/DksA family transcriptional regulator [Myxococcales bacterium]MCB9703137.1 TraR/DksA family transcriptional regulator [Myxococcales bacterium]
MSPAELAALRARLVEARRALVDAGDLPIEHGRDDAITKVDDDAAPLAEMEQVIASRRNQGRSEALARIDAAIRRIDAAPDEFGICEGCDEPIPTARLLLLPHVRLCAACQAEEEGERARTPGGRRHITDYR